MLTLILSLAAAADLPAGAGTDFGRPVERVVQVGVVNRDAFRVLAHELDLTVVAARGASITAYANDAQILSLRGHGYPVAVILDDYRRQSAADLATYATYAEVCSTVSYLASQHPTIARLETLGLSVQGRPILIMKVTSDPGQESARPRIRLLGPHHGNEKIATEIALAFLKHLCERYDTNPAVRALVDSRELWLCPIFNVDGHVANSRYNANGIDLNRDYGYEWYGDGSSPSPISQNETQALREHSERHVFGLEYAYHSTAAYVNYLWDNHPSDPPDSGWIAALSQRYADSTYGSGTQLEPINGWDWYEVHGSCQDYTFGIYGGIATTIETAQPSNRSAVDNICVANHRALLDMVRLAGWGINGLVYDSATAAPLSARIEFTDPYRWPTYASPGLGDFHKMLPAGTYTVRASANGYEPRTIAGVVVPDTGSVQLDVALNPSAPEALYWAQKLVSVERADNSHIYRDWVIRALGDPDGSFYSVGPSPSTVVFDVDPNLPVRNIMGDDVTVYATGTYSLAAANDWQGPWFSLGSGNGRTDFDLANASLDSARYLKLTSAGTPTLDAIGYQSSRTSELLEEALVRVPFRFRVRPNPASGPVLLELPGSPATLRVRDISGRTRRRLATSEGATSLAWDLRDDQGRDVGNGIYFLSLETRQGSGMHRLLVQR
jgi:hypothetical protein